MSLVKYLIFYTKYRQNKNNVMKKEIKITPPEGYEIDKEHSTFDCIKFKSIAKKWRGKKDNKLNGFYIGIDSSIILATNYDNIDVNHNIFATKKQAKSAVAMAQISQIMANDERFGGVVTDEEFEDEHIWIYSINRRSNTIEKYSGTRGIDHFLSFHTPSQRDLFLKENEDLIKDYLMLD